MSTVVIDPAWDKKGVPFCARENCDSYDGKRCRVTGFRPDSICEPEVQNMARKLRAARTAQQACDAPKGGTENG